MRSILSAMAAVLVLGNVPAQALAADEPAYLDDRSDAAAIVRSLYNAINRREYARAWSYFGDTKPAKDFESFAKGYENTAQANVLTGGVASEGAAGSLFYYVPVAVASVGIDGSEQVFAGCYTAKLANPQVQDADFQPLHIEKGSLARSDKPHDEAVPEQCPDAPAPEKTDAGLAKVTAAFAATHADHCTGAAPGTDPSQTEPESYTISFRYKSDADNDPERQARLFRFFCSAGAYNESHIYYQQDEMNGLREVHFAMPEIDVRYENDDSEGKVESINVIGYKAEDRLVNSSYDGEINPEAVMDYDTAP